VQGCNRTPKNFDLVKIRAKSEEICAKICVNLRTITVRALILQKWHPKNYFLFGIFFWKSCINLVIFGQLKENLGKFWGNLGKNGA